MDIGYLQHGKAPGPFRTESVKVKQDVWPNADKWLASVSLFKLKVFKMNTLEQLYYEALRSGDQGEAVRLARLLNRLDEQRQAYGRNERE